MTAFLGLAFPTDENLDRRLELESSLYIPSPSFFQGTLNSIVTAPLSAGEKAIRLVTDPFTGDTSRTYFEPDPEKTGAVGNFLFHMIEDLSMYSTGSLFGSLSVLNKIGKAGTGLLTVASLQGHNEAQALKREKVDDVTANVAGAFHGVSRALGLAIPWINPKNSAVIRMASGALQQSTAHIVESITMSAILRSRGYAEQAKYYEQWGLQTILANALMGAGFGAVSKYFHGARGESKEGGYGDAYKLDPNYPIDPNTAGGMKLLEYVSPIREHDHKIRTMSAGLPINGEASKTHLNIVERAIESTHNGNKFEITQKEADTLSRGMIADDARLDPKLSEKPKEFVPQEKVEPIFHDVDTPKTVISEFVPEGDVALANFEKYHPEEGKILREELTQRAEGAKEWKTLLEVAVECHFS